MFGTILFRSVYVSASSVFGWLRNQLFDTAEEEEELGRRFFHKRSGARVRDRTACVSLLPLCRQMKRMLGSERCEARES